MSNPIRHFAQQPESIMTTMKTILLSVAGIQLFYLATVFFMQRQVRSSATPLAAELQKRGITISYVTFNKFFARPHESMFRASNYKISQFIVLPALLLYFLILPILIYTIVSFFTADSDRSFTFSFPQASLLTTLATFLICALVHELGHYCVALLNGADIRGVGLGITFGFPHFYVQIDGDRILNSQKKNVALGGASFNILLTLLAIAVSWIVYGCIKPGISTPLGRLTKLNGVQIDDVAAFNATVSQMKERFYRYRFVVDDRNLFNSPVHRKASAPEFGALRIPLRYRPEDFQQSGSAMLFLLNEQLVQNEFVSILKPITPFKRTLELLNESQRNPTFCAGSDNDSLCVLPVGADGEVGFFVRAEVDRRVLTLQTTFNYLESMEKLPGGNGLTQMRFLNALNDWLYFLAASSLGVAAVSLLVFPQSSDGAKVLDFFEFKMKTKIGAFSQLVTGAVRGASFVLFCVVMVGLCLVGVLGL